MLFSFFNLSSKILALILSILFSRARRDSSRAKEDLFFLFVYFSYFDYLCSFASFSYSFSCFIWAVFVENITISSMYFYIISVLLILSLFNFLESSASMCASCRPNRYFRVETIRSWIEDFL